MMSVAAISAVMTRAIVSPVAAIFAVMARAIVSPVASLVTPDFDHHRLVINYRCQRGNG